MVLLKPVVQAEHPDIMLVVKRHYNPKQKRLRDFYGFTDYDGVTYWPTYLLRDVPQAVREALVADAQAQDMSVQDVIRGVLCNHYRLHCPPVSYHWQGNGGQYPHILLRLQPKLTRRLTKDATQAGTPIRTIVLTILVHHYERKTK